MIVKDKYGQKISSDEYRAMSKEEKKDLEVIPFVKSFPVYNVAQTNLAEVQPERMQKLVEKFKVPELRDTEGMYAHAAIDRMVQVQDGSVRYRRTSVRTGAFYSPLKDRIVVPMKAQFNIGEHAGGNLSWRHGVLFHLAARDDTLDHDPGTAEP